MSVVKKPQSKKKYYNLRREESGYIIVDQDGNAVSDQNVLVLTIAKLETLLRKELGL